MLLHTAAKKSKCEWIFWESKYMSRVVRVGGMEINACQIYVRVTTKKKSNLLNDLI